MGAGASSRPSENIADEPLRSKIDKYERKIAALEAAGDWDEAGRKRAKLLAFARQEYRADASRWTRAPAWANDMGAGGRVKDDQRDQHDNIFIFSYIVKALCFCCRKKCLEMIHAPLLSRVDYYYDHRYACHDYYHAYYHVPDSVK